jgi:hypothetical protein
MSLKSARFNALIITLMTLAPASLSCQNPSLDQPPATPPVACYTRLISLSSVGGTQSYTRLRYQMTALEVAKDSTGQLQNGFKELNGGGTPTVAISGLITGINQARDSLLCAAYVMGKYSATSEDESTIKTFSVAAYNREAGAVLDMLTLIKEQLSRPSHQGSNADTLHDAERISAITAQQNEAAEDLLQTTTLSLLLAVDTNDPNAKTTEYTLLSCKERSELLTKVAPLAKGDRNAYTVPAMLIQEFFTKHKCRA